MDPARVEVSGRFQGLMFNVVARMVMGRGRYGCVLSVAVADGKPKIHFGHRQHHVKPLRVVEAVQASPLSKESDCGDRDRARGGWRLRKVPVSPGIRPASPAAPDNSQQLRPNPLHATSSLLPSPHGSPRLPCFRSFPTTLLPTMAASGAPALLRAWQRARPLPFGRSLPIGLGPWPLPVGLGPRPLPLGHEESPASCQIQEQSQTPLVVLGFCSSETWTADSDFSKLPSPLFWWTAPLGLSTRTFHSASASSCTASALGLPTRPRACSPRP